ncbi:Gfo/Idh/MocA family protein [Paenibacillus sp. GCM10023252]|uniref:Gfo/Idh/MocA family protein n=1 Tax=Paenibacillus sp. GCM10023252 TaxID=3252649 RepID=UPI003620FCD7
MIRIGLIGLGFMGRTHLQNYIRLEREGVPVQVVALCDMNPLAMEAGSFGEGNIDTGAEVIDFSGYARYTSYEDMIRQEQLDMVDITLPTYLHEEVSVHALRAGLHVLCEKPMAMNVEECEGMAEAADASGKQLMIGQCLRFWPAYEYLKELVQAGTYGAATSGVFTRLSDTPTWGAWLTQGDKSGGAMLDMHVHDTDMIQWLFGKPSQVSSVARNVVPGSGYDIVSTHYKYEDGKVINGQADWTMGGDFGFEMGYRVNFERGNVVFQGNQVKVNPHGEPAFYAELSEDNGYYRQLKYFVESLLADKQTDKATPLSTLESIQIVQAEIASADQNGAWVPVK